MHVAPIVSGRLLTPENSRYLRARCVVLRPGDEVGEHATGDMEEVLLVLGGAAVVDVCGSRTDVPCGHCAFIPPNTRHNVLNLCETETRYVYVRSLEK